MTAENLRTIKQTAESCEAFTEPALRKQIFNAAENGLEKCLIRLGRRIYIDKVAFDAWLEERRASN